MNKKPVHAPISFPVRNDQLLVGGKTIDVLAEIAGSTPFYAYDGQAIQTRIKMMHDYLPDAIRLHYAIKANPFPDLIKDITHWVDGLDVASAGELSLALKSTIDAAHISFAGPAKLDTELTVAIQQGVTINVESSGELTRIIELAEQLQKRPKIALRINPDFELKSAGMKMGGRSSAFGIDTEQAPALLKKLSNLDVDFIGLHIFAGSQNLNTGHLIEAQQATFELAERLMADMPSPMQSFNIGGGLGIPYFPGEQALDLEAIADNLRALLEQYGERLGNPEIVMELGRYLVGEAGVYVCRVIDRKSSRGKTWLVTDGGMHHHLAASGNLGQILRKNYPVVLAKQIQKQPREVVSIAGPLCTPLDLLAENLEMGSAQPGDLIAVLQSGAYGYSTSPKDFLSRPGAKEIYI